MKTARRKDTTTAARWTAGALMSPQPVTIGRKESLATAHRLMTEHGVRHLPVLEHGELVGVISQRDLFLVESIRTVDVDADTVDDAMSSDTYAVAPEVPIATVARYMMRKRYGCAVVMERGRVIGIFTVTDALRLVSTLTRSRPVSEATL